MITDEFMEAVKVYAKKSFAIKFKDELKRMTRNQRKAFENLIDEIPRHLEREFQNKQ